MNRSIEPMHTQQAVTIPFMKLEGERYPHGLAITTRQGQPHHDPAKNGAFQLGFDDNWCADYKYY